MSFGKEVSCIGIFTNFANDKEFFFLKWVFGKKVGNFADVFQPTCFGSKVTVSLEFLLNFPTTMFQEQSNHFVGLLANFYNDHVSGAKELFHRIFRWLFQWPCFGSKVAILLDFSLIFLTTRFREQRNRFVGLSADFNNHVWPCFKSVSLKFLLNFQPLSGAK